jgi:lysozyme
MINGADISNVNGHVGLGPLKQQHHLSFIFLKATEGTGFRDALFPGSWKAAGDLGLARGAYHFAHPDSDPRAEAQAFLSYVKAAGLHDADMLALDLEDGRGMTPASVAAYGREWCSFVQAATGRRTLVYTFLSFAEAGNCAGLGSYPLWIADPSSAPGTPRIPAPWKSWAVHQFGQQGTDLDVANYPDADAMTTALGKGGTDWQEAMMNKLPTLQQGAADKAGQVFYVHRLQALAACYGRINKITAAACLGETGTFDAATKTAVEAVQASRKLTVDGIAGPQTWGVLIAGSAS